MPSNQTFSPVKASRRLVLRARFAQQQHADGHKMVRARVHVLSGCFGVSREAVGPNGQLIVNLWSAKTSCSLRMHRVRCKGPTIFLGWVHF